MPKMTSRNLQPKNSLLIDLQAVDAHSVMGGCGYCTIPVAIYSPPVYTPPVYSPPVYTPACP
jgi:hypothetical protein